MLRELPGDADAAVAAARRAASRWGPAVRDEFLDPSIGRPTGLDVDGRPGRRARHRGRAAAARARRVRRPARAEGAPRRSCSRRPASANQAVDHLLFAGPPGLGKTTLAGIVATEMGVAPARHVGPGARARRRPGRDPHQARRAATCCSSTRSTGCRAPSRRSCTRRWRTSSSTSSSARARRRRASGSTMPPFTLVGATTRTGHDHRPAARPLRPRRPPRLLRQRRAAGDRRAGRRHPRRRRSTATGAWEIARRSRGTPRIANRLLRRVRDFAEVRADGTIDADVAPRRAGACSASTTRPRQGRPGDPRRRCATQFDGGPVGLSTLAISVGEQPETVEDVYEPFLIQQGLIARTPRGRVALAAGLRAPRPAPPPPPSDRRRPACSTEPVRRRPLSLASRCGSPTSTTSCPTSASPRRRSSRATRARLLVDRGLGAARAPPRRRPARAAARRRPLVRQRDQGDPGPAAPAAAPPAERPRCCCSSRSTTTGARGRRCVRPARRLRAGEVLIAATARPVVRVGERTGGRRHVRRRRCSATRDPLDVLDEHGEMPLPPYITRAARPTPTATRRSTPPSPASAAAPTAGLHFTADAARPARRRRRRRRPGRAGRRARHVPADQRRRPARPPDAHRALPRAGRDVGGVPRGRRGSSPSARPACGRWSRRPPRGELERPHRALHPPRLRLAGRRRADDQLPPAAHDAADDDRRVRRRPLATPVRRRRWPSDYRFLSFGDAMLLDRARRRSVVPMHPVRPRRSTAPTARRAPASATTARGTLHARRASCRSAPAARSSTSAPPTTTRSARDRARQHVPPDAAARAPTSSPASAGSAAFAGWDGLTLTDSGGFQVFSLDPKVDDDGVTFRSTYDGSTHRFTPEIAVATQELLGADIQMVLDVCPPLPSPPDVVELAVERTSGVGGARPAPPTAATTRRCSASSRAASTRRMRAESAERTVDARLRRLRHRRAVGGGDPRRDAAGARRRARRSCPTDRPALPDGRRRPGVARRGRRPRRRPVRLRDADPPRPPRHGADRRPARLHVKAARHAARATSRSTPTCALRGVRPAQPRLPPPPVPGRRADGVAAGQPAQRGLDAAS